MVFRTPRTTSSSILPSEARGRGTPTRRRCSRNTTISTTSGLTREPGATSSSRLPVSYLLFRGKSASVHEPHTKGRYGSQKAGCACKKECGQVRNHFEGSETVWKEV